MEVNKVIPVIIPSYEPDDRLLVLLEEMKAAGFTNVVLVNDGSGEQYNTYFEQAEHVFGYKVLVHEVNKGKGRALKTAFAYCLDTMEGLIGCVTADSDGQHSTTDMLRLMEQLQETPDKLVIGSRNFDGDNVPWKSRAGNKITRFVTKIGCGINCGDTQTGLRGIPAAFMKELLNLEGERFEFEMNMLVASKNRYDILELPIETIYDSKENHSSHFHPVKDSIRVYKIFLMRLFKFIASSLTSAVIDMIMFLILCPIFKPMNAIFYVTIATILARVVSATYNYLINYFFVFKSNENKGTSFLKYALLACVQMGLSAGLVTLLNFLLTFIPEIVIKCVVDTLLFFFSYFVQREIVFKQRYAEIKM